jgi:hypothetical protein
MGVSRRHVFKIYPPEELAGDDLDIVAQFRHGATQYVHVNRQTLPFLYEIEMQHAVIAYRNLAVEGRKKPQGKFPVTPEVETRESFEACDRFHVKFYKEGRCHNRYFFVTVFTFFDYRPKDIDLEAHRCLA